MCADAVNAEVLLRFARNELFERAQQTNRHFTALVDEEYVFHLFRPWSNAHEANMIAYRWQYTIRQTKGGDYNVQARGPAISSVSQKPLNLEALII